MALKGLNLPNLFSHSSSVNTGGGRERIGQATIIVSLDGTGDADTIQEGIDLLPSIGGVVVIKEGTYTIKTPLSITNNNISIIGSGKATKITTEINIELLTATSVSGLLINNIYFYGFGTGLDDVAIHLTTVTESIISNCWIENCGMEGIYMDTTTSDNKIEGNIITDVRNGIDIQSGENNTITGNICTACAVYGISISTNSNSIVGNTCNNNINSGIYLAGNANTITGNTCSTNTRYGFFCYGNDNTITGNVISSNVRHGLWIYTSVENVISSNIVSDNDTGNTNTYDGIIVDANSNENVISSNRCRDNNRNEIRIDDNTCNKNIIIGNICLGTHTAAIVDNGTNTHPNGASGTTNLALDDLNIIA